MSNEIPEGYELAETSAAKSYALYALEDELERQGISTNPEEDEFGVELIALADVVVEALLREGITIPEGLETPYERWSAK